jgi:hypothetical protein
MCSSRRGGTKLVNCVGASEKEMRVGGVRLSYGKRETRVVEAHLPFT